MQLYTVSLTTRLAPSLAGSSEQNSVGGGILSTIFSRIIGAEPAVSAEDTGAAEARLSNQEEETQLHDVQASVPLVTAR